MLSKSWKKILIALTLAVVLFLAIVFYILYADNIKNTGSFDFYISKNEKLEDVFTNLKENQILKSELSFRQAANILSFNDQKIKPGKYIISPGMNNYKLISKLRSGKQDPIKLSINNVRDIYQLCGRLGNSLMEDSMSFVQLFTDSLFLDSLGYKPETVLSLFIPDTYEIYWTVSPRKIADRFQKEHDNFWSKNGRKQAIADQQLTEVQAYTLASIVEKETLVDKEKATIAGVYLNRLKQNMKLQADPTVVFALGLFGIQRILFEHLHTPSPYNTYVNTGLPPGPIYMPSIASLEAVIHPEKHDYIFFCAKPGYEGTHSFAVNLQGHAINANAYRDWLNKENIK